PVRVPRELHLLPRRQLGKDLAGELAGPVFELAELGLQAAVAPRELAHLANARAEPHDRLLERQDVEAMGRMRRMGRTRRAAVGHGGARQLTLATALAFSRRMLNRRIGFSLPLSDRGSISSNSKREPSFDRVASLMTICP